VAIEREEAYSVFYGKTLFHFVNGTGLHSCQESAIFHELMGDLQLGDMGDALSFDVASVVEGGDVPSDFIVEKPDVAECEKIYVANLEAAKDDHRRRLAAEGGNEQHANRELNRAHMSRYAELIAEAHANEHPGGTEDRQRRLANAKYAQYAEDAYDVCSYEDGNMCLYYPEEECIFVFRGSDDISDWISNIRGIFENPRTIGGRAMASGFVDEAEKAFSFINARDCRNDNVFIGHSLGGAIAEVARAKYGGTVYSYGAPKLFKNNDGCQSGTRIFHELDPVAGGFFGLNFFHHQTNSQSIVKTSYYNSCEKRHWWGGCKKCECGGCSWRMYCEGKTELQEKACTADSGDFNTDVAMHSFSASHGYKHFGSG
jgi:hypothetical protein